MNILFISSPKNLLKALCDSRFYQRDISFLLTVAIALYEVIPHFCDYDNDWEMREKKKESAHT